MIIRVLFLGVGAALRARLAGNHRFAFGCVLHPSLHKRAVQAGRVGLAEGCWVKTWQSHCPGHSSSSSAESHGCSCLLSVMQLLCARPCREQLLGEGWPRSRLGQAAWLLGRALGGESRDPGLRSGFFTGWGFGQVTSPLCSRLLYFTDFLTGLLEGLHGRMNRRVLWKYTL